MKETKPIKKLKLNKRNVSNLSTDKMETVKGGLNLILPYTWYGQDCGNTVHTIATKCMVSYCDCPVGTEQTCIVSHCCR